MNKNQFKQVWGTCHFPSHEAALRYYQTCIDPSYTAKDILNKVIQKEIIIGRPIAKQNETVFINVEEERYFIGVK